MLQSESQHLKEKLLDERLKQGSSAARSGGDHSSNMQIEETREVFEDISDPAMAFTIANLKNGSSTVIGSSTKQLATL